MTLNNKYGETGDKMVAVSSGSVVRLWVCSDPSKGLVGKEKKNRFLLLFLMLYFLTN